MSYLVDASVLSEPTKPDPSSIASLAAERVYGAAFIREKIEAKKRIGSDARPG